MVHLIHGKTLSRCFSSQPAYCWIAPESISCFFTWLVTVWNARRSAELYWHSVWGFRNRTWNGFKFWLHGHRSKDSSFLYRFPQFGIKIRRIAPNISATSTADASELAFVAPVAQSSSSTLVSPDARDDPTTTATEIIPCIPTVQVLTSPHNLTDLPKVLENDDNRVEPILLSTSQSVQLDAVLPIESPSQDFKSVIVPFVQSLPDNEDGKTVLKGVQYISDCFGFPLVIRDSTYRQKRGRMEHGRILRHAQLFCGKRSCPYKLRLTSTAVDRALSSPETTVPRFMYELRSFDSVHNHPPILFLSFDLCRRI